MLSSQIEQEERRRTLDNDRRLREQCGTFHQFAEAEAQTPMGRFSQVTTAYVIGSTPTPAAAYPAASAHQHDPCGQEPPLGYRIDEMEPLETPSASLAQGPTDPVPADAPSPVGTLGDVQRTGIGSLSHSPTYRRL
jgi:hypothetical protein